MAGSKPGGKRCIFCGFEPRGKLSEEHVFPDWLLKTIPPPADRGRRWRTLGYGIGLDNDVTVRSEGPGGTPVIVRAVCQECNTGWMKEMEAAFSPLGKKLVTGQLVALD